MYGDSKGITCVRVMSGLFLETLILFTSTNRIHLCCPNVEIGKGMWGSESRVMLGSF